MICCSMNELKLFCTMLRMILGLKGIGIPAPCQGIEFKRARGGVVEATLGYHGERTHANTTVL